MNRLLSLEELRALSDAEAQEYCDFLRRFLVEKVSRTGGHLASNLGIVEISVALARVMDLPSEKIVYDTGHQSYVHKILTGRGEAFDSLRSFGGVSGFPRREESVFDAFGTGHSGTGVSAALGLSRAKRLAGEGGFCVAVVGDGAFTGGMVFEALNNVAPDDKVVIILNDNGMSISRSVGRMKSQLNRMRTAGYYRFKGEVRGTLSRVPLVGEPLMRAAQGIKNSVKRSALPMGNLFEQLGLHYFGPADGNHLETVEFLLKEAKMQSRPSIIHLCTKKGFGYAPASRDPARFHSVSPKGEVKPAGTCASALFGEALTELAREDPAIVAVTAAMKDGVGLVEFAERFPKRFFDVGIAEEHAATFAAALAAGGRKPCFAVYSTFYQRAVDQFLHDAALQKLPVVLALDRAGLSGEDGATHHGVFDLPLTLPIPGVRVYAPLCAAEMKDHLRRAFAETEHPSVVRYAKGPFPAQTGELCQPGCDLCVRDFGAPHIAVVTFGRVAGNAFDACKAAAEAGIAVRLIRFAVLKGFDETKLAPAFDGIESVLFVEEGVWIGGFSRYLSGILEERGVAAGAKKKILAIGETFVPHGSTEKLLALLGLDADSIRKEIERFAET